MHAWCSVRPSCKLAMGPGPHGLDTGDQRALGVPPQGRTSQPPYRPTARRYEATLFLFLEHPFDVGDNLLLNDDLYTVKKARPFAYRTVNTVLGV